jgi:hypothetical protein
MRYVSLSFEHEGGITLASVADTGFARDPNGYVTLIVGTGAPIPSWITQANGYTLLDLSAFTGSQNLTLITLRNVVPASTFNCSGQIVPYNTQVYTPDGGLMGEYLPMVDHPTAASLPQVADPLVRANSCGIFPNGRPGNPPACGIVTSSPITISSIPAPSSTASQVAVQPRPPISIRGAGLGALPLGLPYTGTSNFLQITDVTQNWSTGYTGDPCTISIDNWVTNAISLIANVNQNGLCPLAAGDQLTIKVWNPQTLTGPATATVTVAPN